MWKTLSPTKKSKKCECGVMIGGNAEFCPICQKKKIMIRLAKKLSPLGKLMEVSPRRIKKRKKEWWKLKEKWVEEHAKRIRKFKYE